jgi:hypothetical protein
MNSQEEIEELAILQTALRRIAEYPEYRLNASLQQVGPPAPATEIYRTCPSCGAEMKKVPGICRSCNAGISTKRSLLFPDCENKLRYEIEVWDGKMPIKPE